MLDLSEVYIEETSLHERVCALYTRDSNNTLMYIQGKYAKEIEECWDEVLCLIDQEGLESVSSMGVTERYFDIGRMKKYKNVPSLVELVGIPKAFTAQGIKVSEYHKEKEEQYRGIISFSVSAEREFDKWFESLVLYEAQLDFAQQIPLYDEEELTNEITDLFHEQLRNVTEDDMWYKGGRNYFYDRIEFFTSRRMEIQACLPAFPCKSSNTMKVAGINPDRGEEMAMRRLLEVSKMIKDIYPPGIKIWIVSDGHVFSDCIGVDDDIVNSYGAQLREMYEAITSEGCIEFNSLPQLFTSRLRKFEDRYTHHVHLPHYLNTVIDHQSETCRKILMSGCSTDPSVLRSLIDNSDPAKLALYRGFSKFMLEDLALHPIALNSSKKFCRKLSARVAFEMIKVCL